MLYLNNMLLARLWSSFLSLLMAIHPLVGHNLLFLMLNHEALPDALLK